MGALDCLAYVQDVLSRGSIGGVDEGRLLGESEIARRKQVAEEERVAAVVSTPISPTQEASVSAPKSDPLGGRPKTMLSTRDFKPAVSLPRTVVRPAPINPPTSDPLASSASVVSPRNIPLPYSANITSTPSRRPISHLQTATTEESRSSSSTNLPVTRVTRSIFSPTNTTPTTSLPREGGHHAPRSSISISNAVHSHGHWKNKISEVHVPSSSPPTASPSGYPPSPNTYPPTLLSPTKPQAAPVAFDPLGALG